MLNALTALRSIIYRPFTPQAGDNKLEGEVADVLDHCHSLNFVDPLVGESPLYRSQKHFGFLSHHKADAGDAARIFVDTARRIAKERPDSDTYGKIEDLIFLDSTHLKELDKLLHFVQLSKNHILMLTRSTLERPWVLAELCAAHREGLNIVVVLVDFPGREADPRSFRFPLDLETAISDWTEYFMHDQQAKQGSMSLSPGGRGTGTSTVVPHTQGDRE
jgi:hypothetical protein